VGGAVWGLGVGWRHTRTLTHPHTSSHMCKRYGVVTPCPERHIHCASGGEEGEGGHRPRWIQFSVPRHIDPHLEPLDALPCGGAATLQSTTHADAHPHHAHPHPHAPTNTPTLTHTHTPTPTPTNTNTNTDRGCVSCLAYPRAANAGHAPRHAQCQSHRRSTAGPGRLAAYRTRQWPL
jgi:hypothetical protein